MSTTVAPIHKLSLDDVYAMVRAGVLDEDDRVELVDGVLVDMNPIGPEHQGTVTWLTRHVVRDDHGFDVVVQGQLNVPGGYVMPDVMITEKIGRRQLPTSALFVVEVADASRPRDDEKAGTYAAVGVPDYWIADLDARELVVHREPAGGCYATIARFADGDRVQPLIAAIPPVDVSELLGPAT